MPKEIEINIYDVDKKEAERRLRALGAKFIGKYHLKRINFQLDKRLSAESKDALG